MGAGPRPGRLARWGCSVVVGPSQVAVGRWGSKACSGCALQGDMDREVLPFGERKVLTDLDELP